MEVDGYVTMQTTFSDLEYAAKKKMTRRDRFLGEINSVTPWSALVTEIEAEDGGIFLDIDTPEAYRTLKDKPGE